jgi:Uma2 family endonuclease
LLADEFLAELPNRIETDELGQIIMLPLLAPEHGTDQASIALLLKTLLPSGLTVIVCPVSTSCGVKCVDAAWISREHRQAERVQICLTQAPEICIEVISPSNSRRELRKKKRLFFETGAEEVWFRERDGRMVFYRKDAPDLEVASSVLCPEFPARVE